MLLANDCVNGRTFCNTVNSQMRLVRAALEDRNGRNCLIPRDWISIHRAPRASNSPKSGNLITQRGGDDSVLQLPIARLLREGERYLNRIARRAERDVLRIRSVIGESRATCAIRSRFPRQKARVRASKIEISLHLHKYREKAI